jgi:hypothetical protein
MNRLAPRRIPNLLHFCNVNSLQNKLPQLRSSLQFSSNTAFISLAETRLDPAAVLPKIRGFSGHNFPFSANSSGICAYSANSLAVKDLPDATISSPDLEGNMAVGRQIKLFGSLAVNIVTVYLRPNAPIDAVRRVLGPIQILCDLSTPLLVLGDFNGRHPQFGELTPRLKPNRTGRYLADLVADNGLTVLNVRDSWGTPTFRSGSVLDLAITNAPELFSLRIDMLPLLSDHNSLTVVVTDPSATGAFHCYLSPQPLPPDCTVSGLKR